jgi:sigma-E factor negative regulatory protein RseA
MSKQKIEEISALIDGEFDHVSQDAIDHLCEDESLRQTWARYHLIRDCMKGHLPEYVNTEMGDRIRCALEAEPTILAPERTVIKYLKPIAGVAIAASVAVVAILGIQNSNTPLNESDPGQLAANQPVQDSTQQFTFTPQQQLIRHTQTVSSEKVDAKSRLNSYLVNYNEQRANAGKQGILPYVWIVAHETQE